MIHNTSPAVSPLTKPSILRGTTGPLVAVGEMRPTVRSLRHTSGTVPFPIGHGRTTPDNTLDPVSARIVPAHRAMWFQICAAVGGLACAALCFLYSRAFTDGSASEEERVSKAVCGMSHARVGSTMQHNPPCHARWVWLNNVGGRRWPQRCSLALASVMGAHAEAADESKGVL